MKNIRNLLLILITFAIAVIFFGSFGYNKWYKEPRRVINENKTKLEQQIAAGKQNHEMMQNAVQNNLSLYTRSFPLNRTIAQTQYQMWLLQLAQFCQMQDTNVTIGQYTPTRTYATEQFQLRAKCSMTQLYRFLYEFYWASYLHRINTMDIQSVERGEELDVTLVFEGLTLAKMNPQSPYPLIDSLPLSFAYQRRLASGPFRAYSEVAREELFRYSPPGIDDANYTILTGTPSSYDPESERTTVQSRWKIETKGENRTLKIGERLIVGSFDATIEDIYEDMVVLRQTNGYRWVLTLGERLSEAVAVPPNLF